MHGTPCIFETQNKYLCMGHTVCLKHIINIYGWDVCGILPSHPLNVVAEKCGEGGMIWVTPDTSSLKRC